MPIACDANRRDLQQTVWPSRIACASASRIFLGASSVEWQMARMPLHVGPRKNRWGCGGTGAWADRPKADQAAQSSVKSCVARLLPGVVVPAGGAQALLQSIHQFGRIDHAQMFPCRRRLPCTSTLGAESLSTANDEQALRVQAFGAVAQFHGPCFGAARRAHAIQLLAHQPVRVRQRHQECLGVQIAHGQI